jgi:putative SOS response-associated peptidase YedK
MAHKCINARSETAANKPAFRAAFRHRRCLIPANGFFEWQKRGHEKLPFLFRLKDRQPFAFVGVWECWSGPHGDWLDPKATAPHWLQTVLRPYSAEAMQAVPVSRWVNDARHEGPECVRPLA